MYLNCNVFETILFLHEMHAGLLYIYQKKMLENPLIGHDLKFGQHISIKVHTWKYDARQTRVVSPPPKNYVADIVLNALCGLFHLTQ